MKTKNVSLFFAGLIALLVSSGCHSMSSVSFDPRLIYNVKQDMKSVHIEMLTPIYLDGWRVEAFRYTLIDADGTASYAYRFSAKNGKLDALLTLETPDEWAIRESGDLPAGKGWTGTYKSKSVINVERVNDINDREFGPLPMEIVSLMEHLSDGRLANAAVHSEVRF